MTQWTRCVRVAAVGVVADQGVEAVDVGGVAAEGGGGEPRVEQAAVGGVGGHAVPRGGGGRERHPTNVPT